MTDEEYRRFVAWAVVRHDPQTAARMIEERCHPPLPARLTRDPVVVPERADEDGAA